MSSKKEYLAKKEHCLGATEGSGPSNYDHSFPVRKMIEQMCDMGRRAHLQ